MLHEIAVFLTSNIDDLLAKNAQAKASIDGLLDTDKQMDIDVNVDPSQARENIVALQTEITNLERDLEGKNLALKIETQQSENQAENLRARIKQIMTAITESKAKLDVETANSGKNVTKLQQQIDNLERELKGKQLELDIHTQRSSFSIKNLQGDIQRIKQQIQNRKLAMDLNFDKANDSVSNFAEKFTAAMTIVRNWFFAIQAIAGAVIAFRWFANINSKMEQWRLQLKVLLRDVVLARQALTQMKEYADLTPFTDTEVINSGRQMIASGLSDIKKYLALAGDWAAAQGVTVEETTRVLSRLNSGQFGEALERARELGITMKDLWAEGLQFDASGQYTGTIEQMMTAIEKIIKTRFGGMTQELSQTGKGLWSTFASDFENAARDMSDSGYGVLKNVLKDLSAQLQEMRKSGDLTSLGEGIGLLVSAVITLGKLITSTLVVTGLLVQGIKLLFNTAEYGFDSVSAKVSLLRDVLTLGPTAALEKYNKTIDGIDNKFTAQKNAILGIKTATQELSNETVSEAGKAAVAQKAAIDAAYQHEQAVKKQIENDKKLEDARLSVDKAYQKNAVTIAQQEHDNAARWLAMMDEVEKKRQAIQGTNYKPSSEYLDAQKKFAETLTAVNKATIDQADAMGQYVFAFEKLIAEANAIEKLGGDSTVKRYEAMKTAIKEYLDELDKRRTMESEVWSSSEKANAALRAASNENLADFENQLSGIESREKVNNVLRLSERWQVLNQMLRAENLGAQQRKEIYDQERKTFTEYKNAVASSIQDAMQKISALQSRMMSAGNQVISIFEQYGNALSGSKINGLREVANNVRQAWEATGMHSLDQINQILAMKEKFRNWGIDLGINISANDVIEAFRRETENIPDQIAQLKANIQEMAMNMREIGQLAAQRFFEPWMPWIENLRNAMGALQMPVVNMPAVGMPAIAAGGNGTVNSVLRQITNQIDISVKVEGVAGEGMDSLADRVASHIAVKLEPILAGDDFGY